MTETWSPLEEEGSLGQAEANVREYPGDLELLISSNSRQYTEFKSAFRVLTMDGNLVQVPGSRSGVFNTKIINVVRRGS